jgi:nucleoside-diphosphate-sugar epimerase
MMKIVVTGSNGFIGSYLTPYLKKNNQNVIEISRNNGYNICDKSTLENIKEADVIVHLAAKTFVPESFENPYDFYDINFKSTLNALELSRKLNAKFILMSSYSYGEPEYIPIDEKHPLKPHNPYSQSKLISEDLSKSYARDFGVNIIAFRAFNIYGPNQSEQFLIPEIYKHIQKGKVVLKDPRPKRDYIHILDVISALNKAILSDIKGFNIYNLGTGISYSVEDIVNVFKKLVPYNFEVEFKNEYRKNEVLNTVADIHKISIDFDWTPKISIEQGIQTIIDKN